MSKRAATFRSSFSQAQTPLAARSRRRRPVKPCPCGCGTLGFCDPHRARLAAIREDLDGSGMVSMGNRRKKRQSAPVCCNPACFKVRIPPAAFCEDCEAEGFTEEVA